MRIILFYDPEEGETLEDAQAVKMNLENDIQFHHYTELDSNEVHIEADD